MTFVSTEFFVLFASVLALYFFLPWRQQNRFLLAASLLFYGWWDWRFLFLLLGTSTSDYFFALAIDPARNPDRSKSTRKNLLITAVTVNLLVLGVFKYYDFFAVSLMEAARAFGVTLSLPFLHLILPIGISFYTFHAMSYTIDVYFGDFPSCDDYVDYLLYVCFFPHLVAGPIQRAANLLPQIQKPRPCSWTLFFSGAQLMLVGFFKKMVIADNLALLTDPVFAAPDKASGASILFSIYAFAFQIYCDFSGYSDIARGSARMIGFDIPLNFNLPYLATNPREFWKRWHISLSTWLRDYLYIPLGGNRLGPGRTYFNLMATMVLGGLWHGASWHFVLWGAYHGALLSGQHFIDLAWGTARRAGGELSRIFKVFLFFQATCLGWLIFRADNLHTIEVMLTRLCTDWHWGDLRGTLPVKFLLPVLPIVVLEINQRRRGDLEPWRGWHPAQRFLLYMSFFYAIVIWGSPVVTSFIYFQF